MKSTRRLHNGHMKKQQQGLVLIISLIVLVAMTLAGVALLRQIGAGIGIIGNLSFKENATSAGDLGVEAARAYLVTPANANLWVNDDATNGYYSSWDPSFDPVSFNWTNATSSDEILDGAGNTVRYVIHRLCDTPNLAVTAGGQRCVTLNVEGSNSTKIGLDATNTPLSNTVQPYFRITSRITGPRNTLSYTQVIMY
jgi:type IV pilus assembly protein PilX